MILKADLSHLEDVAPLFNAYRVFYKQDSDLERGKQFLKNRIQNNESVIYIAYQDQVAVGFTQLYPTYSSARTTKNWILNDLYVDEKFRKQGVAKELIDTAVAYAKEQGAIFIQLETQHTNVNAQALYHKMDFTVQEPSQEFIVYKRFL